MAAETIKDYLVGLGFLVDEKSFNKFLGSLKKVEGEVEKHAATIQNAYVKAGLTIVSTLSAITSATAVMIDKTAQADLQYQKFGLRMYMTNQLAKQLKITTDALGESLDDIAWMPELRQRYFALMDQAKTMETPNDAQGQLKFIRDIRFEITRLKIEATYGLQWISYYLIKNLAGPLQVLHTGLKSFNNWIVKNMPVWSSHIASALTVIIRLSSAAGRGIADLWHGFKRLWDMLPKGAKIGAGVAGLAALGMIPGIGPFLQALVIASTLVTAFLVLLDDFYGYIDGRKSSKVLSPFWQALLVVLKQCNGLIDDLGGMFKTFFGVLAGDSALEKTASRFENITNAMKWVSFFIGGMAGWISIIFRTLIGLVDTLGLILSGRFKEAGGRVNKILDDVKTGYGDINKLNPLANGIANTESGGAYEAVNPHSGARGKYQIMPANWSSWAKEAGLGSGAPMTPENQDKVANFKLAQYMKEFGDERLVAAAWYAGPGYARSLQAGKPLYDPYTKIGIDGKVNAKGAYPSVAEYVAKVTGQSLGNRGYDYLFAGMNNYNAMTGNVPFAGGGAGMINVGGVNVNVASTNATPEEVYTATLQGVQDAMYKRTARNLRDAAGVIK